MKNYLILLQFLLLINFGFSQNRQTERADKYFETYQYISAIEEYLKLADSKKVDKYICKQLADSYYNVYNTSEAVKWYAKAIEGSQDAELYYRYAQSLKSLGKYQEANKQMDIFSDLKPKDQRAIEHLQNPNYVPSLADKAKLFDVFETKINSKEQSDFGAILSNDNVFYFTSTRNTGNKTDKWVNQPYLDIYFSSFKNDVFTEPQKLNELNTPYHDGPITISSDGKTMFFARDGHSEGVYEKDKKHNIRVGEQGLYKALKVNDKWTDVQALPINNKSYSVSHPSLSKEGKTLYFASNMPGGFGDTDIWKISINGNSYGQPENLGAKINTAGKEGFPFISEDDVLYFSSSGRQGFGGLDIFKFEFKDSSIINVGHPVNTEKDDFSFSFNVLNNVGFFSSNRKGVDDIYKVVPVCNAEIIVLVKDKKSGKILTDATVSILDNKLNLISTKQTNSKGEVEYEVNCKTPYVLQSKKQDYEQNSLELNSTIKGKNTITLELEPIEVIITETEVILKNIYFEYNKSNITVQGATELDKLVSVMKNNPSMEILVKSHTDSNGSVVYNLNLSNQRAQSTVQYLISKGISKERLSAKGLGFTEPKIDCKENCNDEQDAQNRRSEFLIVKK
jgi:outer membrane protein OmpA-like peptidoglycan-associated protein/tetratricopeptide (TPR) repeat protein